MELWYYSEGTIREQKEQPKSLESIVNTEFLRL